MVGWNPLIGDQMIQWFNDWFPAPTESAALQREAEKMVGTWNTEPGQPRLKSYLKDPKGQLPDGSVSPKRM
jgi:hypothetical protein